MVKRVFLIVLDSLGIGEMPDAAEYGDAGSNTLRAVAASDKFRADTLRRLGIFNIDTVTCGRVCEKPQAAYARLSERSKGKDTTTGHWEIAGLVSETPFPVFSDGFPDEIIDAFSKATGRGVLCNKPYSGTQVINDYGDEHVKTGSLIVYTSADSVFQIAAHEDIVPVEELYRYCEIARRLLVGKYAVGRVIARPFVGTSGKYERTSNRHDFSVVPPENTLLDVLSANGKDVITVGKISDIFAGKGVTESYPTKNNRDGMRKTSAIAKKNFSGLCFVNLVDFDMQYGHRNDIDGYAQAVAEFDSWLDGFIKKMKSDDVLIITADHGCDPSTESTDHSREYIPMLVYGERIKPVNLHTAEGFDVIAASVAEMLGVKSAFSGDSFCEKVLMGIPAGKLIKYAQKAQLNSYAPYSDFNVGAALLSKSGKVYTGCNIENAAFSPTCCAERVAVFKAVGEGERVFDAIAVVGGKDGKENSCTTPCGVCRQVLCEFAKEDIAVICAADEKNYEKIMLSSLLPDSFGQADVKTEEK